MTQFFQVLKLKHGKKNTTSCFMMTQFFQVLKHHLIQVHIAQEFYDDSILSGTKTEAPTPLPYHMFYDDSILSGTKTY